MPKTFFFYDLETSGFYPRTDKIMQFGGQRTDMDLKPIGDPVNVLIKLSPDTLPSPDAIMVTGITPQKTLQDGITEVEFARLFNKEIALPDTIFVGFNSIRFDDEFMRFFLYRNYTDAYEWQWKDGRSRWDLLDVVRMTRALRPEGIKWPVDSEGKPGNRLEMLTSLNDLDHADAHDALSDVMATIALARLIKQKQPKLFNYLLALREKKQVAKFVSNEPIFVYSSGKYPAEFEKTTVVMNLAPHPKKQAVLVYDLRHNPKQFMAMSSEALVEAWKWKKDSEEPRLPVKTLQFNRCPAIAPLKVLDRTSQERLGLDMETINKHLGLVRANQGEFVSKLEKALAILDKQQQTRLLEDESTVEARLYDDFIDDADRNLMLKIQSADPQLLTDMVSPLSDTRLKALMPLYKGRNFPKYLTDEERATWGTHIHKQISKQLPAYFDRLDELAKHGKLTDNQKFLLEELRLYGESVMS